MYMYGFRGCIFSRAKTILSAAVLQNEVEVIYNRKTVYSF